MKYKLGKKVYYFNRGNDYIIKTEIIGIGKDCYFVKNDNGEIEQAIESEIFNTLKEAKASCDYLEKDQYWHKFPDEDYWQIEYKEK